MSFKSQLGYIMDLLELTGTDLAKSTDLDRTLISKWKNNARQLKTDSSHFPLIITHLILHNTNRHDNVLERFFREIYPTVDRNEPDYLQGCLTTWLTGDDLGYFHSFNDWRRSESSLYTANIEIFKGDEGKMNALIEFFEYALDLPDVHEIFISDTEDRTWFHGVPEFYETYHGYIDQLASKGHHINIIYSIKPNSKEMYKIDYARLSKYFTGNVTAYQLPDHCQGPSLYIIHNHMLVTSANYSNRSNNRYVALHRDLFTIQHMVSMFAKRLSGAEKLLSSYSYLGSNLKGFTENLMASLEPNRSNYYIAPLPPFSTLPEGILNKILMRNTLTDDQKDQILMMYHANREFFMNSCQYGQVDAIISYHHLMSGLNQDKIKLEDISSIINQDIYITKNEFLAHISNLRDLMIQCPSFKVHVSHFNQVSSFKESILWIIEDTLLYTFAYNKTKNFVLSNSKLITREAIKFIQKFIMEPNELILLESILDK